MEVEVGFVALDTELAAPAYAHHDDAGADLVSAETFLLQPGERRLVGTGVAIALPEGYAGFVHPRSGLAARHGISIVNAPGTVDAGYRGEILVCLVNTDTATAVRISRGDRIAQLVVQRVARARFVAVPQLPDSTATAGRSMGTAGRSRGTGGHGSTGGLAAGATTDEEQQPA
ncbi:MAG TPA: dUTP diphosphatase [Microlunatus sp.]